MLGKKKGGVDLKQSAGKVLDTMFMIYTVPQIGVFVRVCVCVCVCVFILFHRKGFFRLR